MTKEILTSMNQLLQAEDDCLTADFTVPQMPVIFIVEPGRSGSTLFMQLLINAFEIGYVSNLLAKYWLAPFIGSLLERELLNVPFELPYESRFGLMEGAYGTNEWGWFWKHWLLLSQDEYYLDDRKEIDSEGLLRKLAAIESVKKVPLLFDNVYASSNIVRLNEFIPNLLVVQLERDPYYVSNSLLNARINRYGSIAQYYGHRPRNIEEVLKVEDPVEQIVYQTKLVFEDIHNNLTAIPPEKIFKVNFNGLMNNPQDIIREFENFMKHHNLSLEKKKNIIPTTFESRNTPHLVRKEYEAKLNTCFQQYFLQ